MSRRAEPYRRLFFALWPGAAARAQLLEAAGDAIRHCGGRPVPADNLHVTLAFLGNVPQARTVALGQLAAAVASGLASPKPLTLRWMRLEHWAQARVLCAVAQDAPAVDGLAAALQSTATAQGFSPDLKPFRAHVTLAREIVDPAPPAPLSPAIEWTFAHFALIESRTGSAGAVYSVVDSWPLDSAH